MENQQKDVKRLHAFNSLRSLENQQKEVKTLHVFDWLRSLENQQKEFKTLHAFDWLKSLANQQKDATTLHVFDWLRSLDKVKVLSIQAKVPKNSKRGQMVRQFRGTVSRKSGNCFISEERTIRPKILEIPEGKSKWKGNFQKSEGTSRGCPLFRKF